MKVLEVTVLAGMVLIVVVVVMVKKRMVTVMTVVMIVSLATTELILLWETSLDGKTKASTATRDSDKVEMIFTAERYQDRKCQASIEEEGGMGL